MKRAFLTGLGLEKDIVDQIMAAHGTTVGALDEQINALTKERDDALKLAKDFEGVDLKALQNAEKTLKEKYEQQIKDMKIDGAIEKALAESKAKHTDLLISKFDREQIKVDEKGEITGIDEQINGFKESYKDLFATGISGGSPANPDPAAATNTYEQLVKNADSMSVDEIAKYFNEKEN